MRPRRLRRLALWMSVALCAVLVPLWCVSGFFDLVIDRRTATNYSFLQIGEGGMRLWRSDGPMGGTSGGGFFIASHGPENVLSGPGMPRWSFWIHISSGEVFVPLWIPFVISAAAAVWLAWGLLELGPGHCPACGYSLAGLAAGAGCPECGKARAQAPR